MQMTTSLHRMVQQRPDHALTVFGDRVRTAAEAADRIARLAAALQSIGVATGDRVGMLSLNSDRYHEYLLATPWAGAVVNPINIRWSTAEIAYSLKDCDTRVLMIDDAFLPMLPSLREQASCLATVIYCGELETPDGLLGYEALLAAHEPIEDENRGGSDPYGVFYTGGTTGFPRGVTLSHDNMMISALAGCAAVPAITSKGRNLHCAPMFHLADLAMWNTTLVMGATQVMIPTFTAAGVVHAIDSLGATSTLMVPTMIQMLVDSPEAATADLSNLTLLFYGGAPMPEDLFLRAQKALPSAGFTQGYGMTELAPLATILTTEDHLNPKLWRAAGRGTAQVQIRILDPLGNEMPRGEVGEVAVKGDNVMLGYRGKPEETAAAVRDGWMHTGDGGYMDDAGYVFIVDRIKDMIITGGENVFSTEVENALTKHEAVATCAVIGVPDDAWGERVHAVVVLHPSSSVTSDELRDFARSHIANYKIPRTCAFVGELPVSGAGKVLKRQLRAMDWS